MEDIKGLKQGQIMYVIKKVNRGKAMKPKKDKFWCKHCDACLVGEYSKCPVCRKRNGKKRFKK